MVTDAKYHGAELKGEISYTEKHDCEAFDGTSRFSVFLMEFPAVHDLPCTYLSDHSSLCDA